MPPLRVLILAAVILLPGWPGYQAPGARPAGVTRSFQASSGVPVLELEPSADTYLDSWSKDQAFGSKNELLTYAAFRKALLRFDLSGLPPSATILSAKLSLTFKTVASGLQLNPKRFYVYDVGPEFSESEATFNEWSPGHAWGAPGLGEFKDYHLLPSRPKPFFVSDPGRYAADITDLAKSALGASRRSLAVTVFAPEFNTASTIASREDADAGRRPRLAIEYSATAPAARAEYVAKPEGSIFVDGTGSSLPDGTKAGLSYAWTVDRPSYGSSYHAGDQAGNTAALSFKPDAPGYYVLRLRVTNPAKAESGETTLGVISPPGSHPRLHLNSEMLEQLRRLKHSADPVWTRFYNWVKGKPTYCGIEGGQITSYLLAYLLTGEQQYFNWSWELIAPQIYRNKVDRANGMISLIDIYKGDNHNAAFTGGPFEAQVALLYDWGYDRLTEAQRADLIAWMNEASEYNYLRNGSARSFFRNDGAAATYGIAAAAYATLGDNPEAGKLLGWYRDNWDEIRAALDIMGSGGSLTEGNAYGTAPTASNLIRTANLVYYASGEDLFSSHVWFRQRLMYDAFATYPGTVGGPGSPVPGGWPGVMLEQASLGGDGRRGVSFHSVNLRPNGLILSRRFAGTREAETWNWVFRQPAVDQVVSPANSFLDLLYYSPPQLVKPTALSHYAPGTGYVYIRSDWDSPDATWIALWAGPHLDTHQHLDQGAFAIFKRRDLAPKTGCMDLNKVYSPHSLAYYTRTISSNGLLIGNPSEIFQNFISGMGCDANGKGASLTAPDNSGTFCIPNDGGQRTMSPFGLAALDADTFNTYRDVFETARIVSFDDTGQAVTVAADLTNAYNSPRYSTPGNTPKVRRVYRRLVYLRDLDVIVLGDTVESTDPGFEKKWLLHSLDQLRVGGTEQIVDAGETIHTGVNEARIVVDDSQPSDKNQTTADMRKGYATLLLRTVFPSQVSFRTVGGRNPADTAHPDVYAPDTYNMNRTHYHRHIKDFWVRDFSESRIPNHRSFNWMPESPPEVAASAYDAIFGPGYGRWRLEIEPAVARTTEHFLTVLKPSVDASAALPATEAIETADTFGVRISAGGASHVVVFSKGEPAVAKVDANGGINRPRPLPGMPGQRR